MSDKISFSEEQAMMLETAQNFCASESSIDKVRKQLASNEDYDQALWKKIVELGWLSIAIPEAYGGLELGLAGVVPVVESMGRQLVVSPFLATTLAVHTLVKNGSEQQKQNYLPKIAEGMIASLALTEVDGSWLLDEISASAVEQGEQLLLSGSKHMVLDAKTAGLIIVSLKLNNKICLVALEQAQIPQKNLIKENLIDETRNGYQLILDGISVPKSQLLQENDIKSIEQAALLLLSAEMVGGIASCLNTIVDYLNTRKQFGKIIGSYQALKHPTVNILLGMEEARSLVYHAATIFDEGDEKQVEAAVRMAKASASEHFAQAGDRAVQFHGGFGFTYDCDAQLFLRRAIWCQYQFGDERYQRQLLAPLLLD